MPANRSGARPRPVKSKPVALQKIDAQARIRGLFAETWLTFVFYNSEKVNIEASFCFPLASGAVICDLQYAVNTSLQNAVSDNSESAFDTYDRALEDGECTFLLEKLECDIVALSVGNLPPGKQAEVRVRIVSLLRETDDVFRFELPIFLTPRYVPEEINWAEHHVHCPTFIKTPPYELSIRVAISDFSFKQLRSPSHLLDIISKTPEGVCRLVASDKGIFNCGSFILDLEPDSELLPFCSVGIHPDGSQAMCLMMKPEFAYPPDFNDTASELVFMLDCSDSMQGDYFDMARESLELCLKWLTPGCRFNICLYGDDCLMMSEASLVYDRATLAAALSMLSNAKPDMGGSELKVALQQIFSEPAVASREIVLFTDGDIYNTGDIIDYVKNSADGARFYTFGIGTNSPQQLVRGLAQATGGLSEVIEPYDTAQDKVLRQLSRIFQPRVTDISFTAINADINFINTSPSAIYDGDSLTVFAQVEKLGDAPEVIVHGRVDGQLLAWKISIENLGSNELIPLLALDGSGAVGTVNADSSLVAVVRFDENEPAYYPSFRPVPIVNQGNANRAGTRSLVHEAADSYGGVPVDPRQRCMHIMQQQTAEGWIDDGNEPVKATQKALMQLRKSNCYGNIHKAAIRKAEAWLKDHC
jgi:Ca-activated chloride channel homolog